MLEKMVPVADDWSAWAAVAATVAAAAIVDAAAAIDDAAAAAAVVVAAAVAMEAEGLVAVDFVRVVCSQIEGSQRELT